MRPDRLVVVLGTATAVGKTWVSAQVLTRWRRHGTAVAARKPVQSFAPSDGPTDAEVLAGATGQRPEEVCPTHRSYPLAMAPPVAARVLGSPPYGIGDLLAELAWPPQTELGLVETAGGPRSPLAADGDCVDLAAGLGPDLALLVADAGLGAINAVRLSVHALSALSCPLAVMLNHYDDGLLHRTNRDCLVADGIDVLVDVGELTARVM